MPYRYTSAHLLGILDVKVDLRWIECEVSNSRLVSDANITVISCFHIVRKIVLHHLNIICSAMQEMQCYTFVLCLRRTALYYHPSPATLKEPEERDKVTWQLEPEKEIKRIEVNPCDNPCHPVLWLIGLILSWFELICLRLPLCSECTDSVETIQWYSLHFLASTGSLCVGIVWNCLEVCLSEGLS